ncbi:MAG: lipoprotein-releasing system ATP-binding protein LolD, partial [Candidatus Tectomicrobia bacterium]|nr:lipoprotein-releasing system ATP-binding protein LolD [Candidatus Tectomicrobia bacterium]
DEPTGNLDSQTSASIYELLRRLNEERGQTFIIVTHNAHLADQMDRVIRLVDGKVYQEPSIDGLV